MGIQLDNSFVLDIPPDQAWLLLSDVERIAPCVPGAQLTSVEGDQYRGKVKVKLGPITAEYTGVATIKERDPEARRLVVEGKGKDIRGQGTAGADVVMIIAPAGAGSEVKVATNVQLTGKVAQLGRGVMQDVSARLIDQFVENLRKSIAVQAPTSPVEPAPAALAEPTRPGESPVAASGPRVIDSAEPEAIDLVRLGGSTLPIKSFLIGAWMAAVLLLLILILLK